MWIILSPVSNPCELRVIEFVEVLTPAVTNPTGFAIILLLVSLYDNAIFLVFSGLTETITLWSGLNPWVCAVETVIRFLWISPVIAE